MTTGVLPLYPSSSASLLAKLNIIIAITIDHPSIEVAVHDGEEIPGKARNDYRLATERATLSIRFTLARVPSRSQSSRYSSLGLWYQDAIG